MEEKQSLDCAGFLTEKWVFDTANTGPMFDASGVSFAGFVRPSGPAGFGSHGNRAGQETLRLYRAEMSRCSVPGCTGFGPLEVHHLIGGRGGRSDERANLLPGCMPNVSRMGQYFSVAAVQFSLVAPSLNFPRRGFMVTASPCCMVVGLDPVRPRSKLWIPIPAISPNARRAHWSVVSRARKRYRQDCGLPAMAAVRSAGLRQPLAAAICRSCLASRGHRGPDGDNALASLKSAFDGFVDARVLAGDAINQLDAPARLADGLAGRPWRYGAALGCGPLTVAPVARS